LENNVLQLYTPHNYFFSDDFYSFFCKFIFNPFLRNKIDPMPLKLTIFKIALIRLSLTKASPYYNSLRSELVGAGFSQTVFV
jgi:hypothetical protein